MKIITTIARVLLGLMFLVFGLNGFLHFIPTPPPSGVAGQFMGALYVSHYLSAIWVVQVLGGVLLLSGRFVAAGLAVLAPVLVNIALFHACMAPVGYAPAVTAGILWVIVFVHQRAAFRPLLLAKGVPPGQAAH